MNKFILILAMIFSNVASASFSENSKRYFSPKDMFTVLAQKFPVMADRAHLSFNGATDTLPQNCWSLGYRNGTVTGLSLPAIGSPAAVTPGAGFVRWWGSCAERITQRQIFALNASPLNEALWQKFWNADLLNKLRDKANTADPFHAFNETEWNSLTARQRRTQIRFLIEELIGPNAVIADLGYSKGIDDLADIIATVVPEESTLKLNEANQKFLTAITLREEFLTY